MNRSLLIAIFVLLGIFRCSAQTSNLSNLRARYIQPDKDTLIIDTLSLVPGSVHITTSEGESISDSIYRVDHVASRLIWLEQPSQDSLFLKYRVFRIDFSKKYFHKDIKLVQEQVEAVENPFIYRPEKEDDDIFQSKGLNKNGSISRGITFGNNQDVVVNSNLNLQLSGKLTEEIDILAAISDENIPIQPEGNTQQLQEFDRVFIQLSDKRSKLIAGDFQLEKPPGYFMNFYKKAQGGSFTTRFFPVDKNDDLVVTTGISAAVSRGKFSRNVFQGIEGNQGPYRLRGADNETFVIILSGTEKIYIDGRLMIRGQENDYVIDYNTAEITFTPKQLITKDSRIVVEFQYSVRSYARSLLFSGTEMKSGKLALRLNLYSEQDSKNQPLQQQLTEEEKNILRQVGDSVNMAVTSGADSVGFINDEVRYKKVDTTVLVNGAPVTFEDIYVQSTDPDSAVFRVSFSDVGQGNGNYVRVRSSANGKVFEWRDPVNGVPQGSFEPVILLVPPKQSQLLTVGGDYKFSDQSLLSFEYGLSNNDINTFSSMHGTNDIGNALKFRYSYLLPLSKVDSAWSVTTNLDYEFVQETFNAIERFRRPEFERDWNISRNPKPANENLGGIMLTLNRKDAGFLSYRLNAYTREKLYEGRQHMLTSRYDKRNYQFDFNGSMTGSETLTGQSRFVRHQFYLQRQFNWLILGVAENREDNRFFITQGSNGPGVQADSLLPNSYIWDEWEVYATNPDTSINRFRLFYKNRIDKFPVENKLKLSALGESIGFTSELLKNRNSIFKSTVTLRQLEIKDTALTDLKPENSILSRFEYNARMWKGTVTSSTFYELGSGQEVKKEFSFIEVAPGQGNYIWNDYNDNNVKELDEFEIAIFQNEANYIKVFTPTTEFVRSFNNQFNEVLYIRAPDKWQGADKGLKKFFGKLSNQFVYRTSRKTTQEEYSIAVFNPFEEEVTDTNLVNLNSSLRNTFYYNRNKARFGAEFFVQDNRNRVLLTNGIDTRTNKERGSRLRWNLNRQYMTALEVKEGIRTSKSQFFSNRNFRIDYYEIVPEFTYQPNTKFRTVLKYSNSNKKNLDEFGGEIAVMHDVGMEIKYNMIGKGNLLLNINYVQISYDGNPSSPLAFEMLEGLNPGNNFTWSLSLQRNISKSLQMDINYNGRKSEGNNTIHTGGVQLRAFF